MPVGHHGRMSHSVFFSYSHADKPLARKLARGLQDDGIHVWIDEGELRAGDSIIERIAVAIDSMDFVVALVSAHSVGSSWCRKELSLAITGELSRHGVKVLPVRVGDVPMPLTLADKLYLTIDETDVHLAVKQLVDSIYRHASDPSGAGVTDPMGAIRRRIIAVSAGTSMADALLRQYLALIGNGNYRDCFIDWLRRPTEARQPDGSTLEISYWLYALAALSGCRLGDADPTHIATFGGWADQFRDYSVPEQAEMSQLIWRLYSGEGSA